MARFIGTRFASGQDTASSLASYGDGGWDGSDDNR